MEPIALSISEACKATGLGRTSLYGLIRKGSLEAVKVGRRNLVLVASIKRLIEENRAQGGANGS